MSHIYRGPDGNMKMNRKGLFQQSQRLPGEKMKEKELVCWTCGSLSHRVQGIKCKDCDLRFEEERVGIELPGIRSAAGIFEDNF